MTERRPTRRLRGIDGGGRVRAGVWDAQNQADGEEPLLQQTLKLRVTTRCFGFPWLP